jgi:hypothetical protein
MKRYHRPKTAFRKAYEILSRGIVTEWELRMLRKNIRWSFSRNRKEVNVLTQEERWALLELFEERSLDLTKEQQKKGIEWLRNTHFRKDGSQRRSSKLSSQHLYVIRNFSHFTFEGFASQHRSNGQLETQCVYRTYAKNGIYFDYVVDPSWFGAKVNYRDVEGESNEVSLKLLKGGAQ